MTRFAWTVASIEVVLTICAASLVTMDERTEPFLLQEDLARMGMAAETFSNEKRFRLGAIASYDTNAVLAESRHVILVSFRVESPREEFERLRAAELGARGQESGLVLVDEETRRVERGYAIRQRGATGVRSELVRLRGGDLLLVKVSRPNAPPGEQARCERMARLIQEHMMRRLGWRKN